MGQIMVDGTLIAASGVKNRSVCNPNSEYAISDALGALCVDLAGVLVVNQGPITTYHPEPTLRESL